MNNVISIYHDKIQALKIAWAPYKNTRISDETGQKLCKLMDGFNSDPVALKEIFEANIPFLSKLALNRLTRLGLNSDLTQIKKEIARFVVGKEYTCRSACNYDSIFRFTILKRTKSTITIEYHGREVSRKVRMSEEGEWCFPMGQFSMAPVIRA